MGWVTAVSASQGENVYGGYQTYTIRVLTPAFAEGGTKVRVTCVAGTNFHKKVAKMYIGPKGSGVVDFSSATQLTFDSGSASKDIAVSTSAVTDEINFTSSGGTQYVVAFYDDAGSTTWARGATTLSGWDARQLLADDAATTGAVSGSYGDAGVDNALISLIEVFQETADQVIYNPHPQRAPILAQFEAIGKSFLGWRPKPAWRPRRSGLLIPEWSF